MVKLSGASNVVGNSINCANAVKCVADPPNAVNTQSESHPSSRRANASMPSLLSASRPAYYKAPWLADRYAIMRGGVKGHPQRIDASNVALLDGADFVFIAVDHGPSRGIIARYLRDQRIPFIDVGIGIDKRPEVTSLIARARVTLAAC